MEPEAEPKRKRRREGAAGCLTVALGIPLVAFPLLLMLPLFRVNHWIGSVQVIADRGPSSGVDFIAEPSRYRGQDTDIYILRLGHFAWGVQVIRKKW